MENVYFLCVVGFKVDDFKTKNHTNTYNPTN